MRSASIVMEPTSNALQIGCLGNLDAAVEFRGRSAHSARPWLGENAIHAAVRGLRGLADAGIVDVEVDVNMDNIGVGGDPLDGGTGCGWVSGLHWRQPHDL